MSRDQAGALADQHEPAEQRAAPVPALTLLLGAQLQQFERIGAESEGANSRTAARSDSVENLMLMGSMCVYLLITSFPG